jgi:hypothetical protein
MKRTLSLILLLSLLLCACGTSGGTYKTAIEFFNDDVLIHKPTHAVVAFGVNDSNRWALERPRCKEKYDSLKAYYDNFKKK